MNLSLVTRAVLRHRHMHDRPAYTELLEHVDAHGDAWKVPQREVAEWWERRQRAALQATAIDGGRLRVACSLENGVIEVDGAELRVPPFELSLSSDVAPGDVAVTYGGCGDRTDYLREILGHLGYSHLSPARPGQPPDIREEEIAPLLDALYQSADERKRYEAEDLNALRGLVRSAHHRRGIPELRLWTLPHRAGRPYRVGVSTRYDVDKAIVNLPAIHELEARYGLRSTAYVRPMGVFYSPSEIRRYRRLSRSNEAALHGEFVTMAERRYGDEFAAARAEKAALEDLIGEEVHGVCLHGGELRINTTPRTRDAIEAAGFKYETMYRNDYYLPLHLPDGSRVRNGLSIGQHFADISVALEPGFSRKLAESFIDRFSQAAAVGGIFVPVMHPIYFGLGRYLRHPVNLFRFAVFVPRFLLTTARMQRDQQFSNLMQRARGRK